MKNFKTVLFGLSLLLAFSCSKDNDLSIQQENGSIWLSGGLAHCAEQIRLDDGIILIVKINDVISYKSGDRVSVKYKEVGVNEFCAPSIDCEIIEIKRLKE